MWFLIFFFKSRVDEQRLFVIRSRIVIAHSLKIGNSKKFEIRTLF